MNPKSQEETLFAAALALPPEERAAYLDKSCATDNELRRRLEILLNAHVGGTFLEHAAAPIASHTIRCSPGIIEAAGDHIGRFRLLQQIGEGGCGVVYMAEQEEPVKRRVALKIIKLGMDTKQVIARFEAERQALAMMDHPNIAKVLDGGATETGRPYFVMELVRGVKITDYCDQNNLATRPRLELFLQVCRAVQHAHSKGIIHRDLKPSNILVTSHDGVPVPKVIDFGIAKATQGKLTDLTLFTAFEQFMGTPAYMSPEQAEMSGFDIDIRSDIYSLGVLLYELLIGKTPFDSQELIAAGLDALRQTIREKEPDRPSTKLSTMLAGDLMTIAKQRQTEPLKLVSAVRGDLDWIVMKCLEKERHRRYETANDLASDLHRHLNEEPVAACPPSQSYRFRKLVRRNQLAFAAGASVLTALIVGLGFAVWQFTEKTIAYKKTLVAEERSRTEAIKSKAVVQAINKILQGVGPSVALGHDTFILREVLARVVDMVDTEFKNNPEVDSDLRMILARTYIDLGQYSNAVQMAEQALNERRKIFGDDLPVADADEVLGSALVQLEENHGAEICHLEALKIRQNKLGPRNAEVARSLLNVGVSLGKQRNLPASKEKLDAALSMLTELRLENTTEGSQVHRTLGSVLGLQGDLPAGEDHEKRALAIDYQFGTNHPRLIAGWVNLAGTLQAENKLPDAEGYLIQALHLATNLFQSPRGEVALILQDLGEVLTREGKLPQARGAAEQGLNLARALARGQDDPRIAGAMVSLARTEQAMGELTNAETRLREALAIFEQHPELEDEIETTQDNLADVLRDKGDLEKAKEILTDRVKKAKSRSPVNYLSLVEALAPLSLTLIDLKQFPTAKERAEECLDIRQSKLPPDWQIFYAHTLLGAALLGQGDLTNSGPHLIQGHDGMRRSEAQIPPDTRHCSRMAIQQLQQFYEMNKDTAKAEELRRELEEFDKKSESKSAI